MPSAKFKKIRARSGRTDYSSRPCSELGIQYLFVCIYACLKNNSAEETT
jgi:hypothetical protein